MTAPKGLNRHGKVLASAALHAKAHAKGVWTNPNWGAAQVQAAINWADPEYRYKVGAAKRLAVQRMQAGEGFLYVAEIFGTDAIKIGFALDPKKRVQGVSADFCVKARLLASGHASLEDEHRLHRRLRGHSHKGYHSHEFYHRAILSHEAIPDFLRVAA